MKLMLITFDYLDKVRNYFGDNVAFYFAFLEYYTKALIPTSILGEKHRQRSDRLLPSKILNRLLLRTV
jgi:hypothetical protein